MRRWLERPETRGIPLDSPEMTRRRRDILTRAPLLKRVYRDWYARIEAAYHEAIALLAKGERA